MLLLTRIERASHRGGYRSATRGGALAAPSLAPGTDDECGRVLVLGRLKGSGLSSGAAIDNEWADLDTFSAGRVIRRQIFLDHAEGLEAAGLRE
jgi:hypothetical protein